MWKQNLYHYLSTVVHLCHHLIKQPDMTTGNLEKILFVVYVLSVFVHSNFFVPYICIRSVSRRLKKLQFSFVFPYFVEVKKKSNHISNYSSNIPPGESKFYTSTFDEFYLI